MASRRKERGDQVVAQSRDDSLHPVQCSILQPYVRGIKMGFDEVELIMNAEEEFQIVIPDSEAEQCVNRPTEETPVESGNEQGTAAKL